MSTKKFLYGKIFSNLLYGKAMKIQKLSGEYLLDLGHRIKIIRTVLKLDQQQMSELIGTAQSQISKIEIGRSAPTLHHLLMIKKFGEKDEYLRENLTWEWILEGKGKGIIG
jgi:DNA-binding XRE family transcriptional regulator